MEKQTIIGRKGELAKLAQVLESDESAFLAIYGRRRIGKTYLIENYFKDKGLFFHLTGIQDATLEVQLQNFSIEFSDHFMKGKSIDIPKSWLIAFQMLRKEIEKIPKNRKVILFLDELPWLATPRSNFLQGLDHLWNRYLFGMKNVILIVCGSAASWMIDNVINSKGGLHGRVTKEIRLLPFTLKETEEFLLAKGIRLDKMQIIELYMCFGGVAKYLSYLEKGKSAGQLIGELCFSYNAPLIAEFYRLFRSLFKDHEAHVKIVRALAAFPSGLSYQELVKIAELSGGGTLSRKLEELKQSGFIAEIPILDDGSEGIHYILIDEYSLFYIRWNEGVSQLDLQERGASFWIKQRNTTEWKVWAALAFESICLKHVSNIKAALGLAAVATKAYKWRHVSKKGSEDRGAQIDLVIDRADQSINLCEIKFYSGECILTKEQAENLRYKRECFIKVTGTKKATFTTLITTNGAKRNQHFLSAVDQAIAIDSALF